MSEAETYLTELSEDLPSFILDTGFFKTKDEHRSDGEFSLPDLAYCRIVLETLCKER